MTDHYHKVSLITIDFVVRSIAEGTVFNDLALCIMFDEVSRTKNLVSFLIRGFLSPRNSVGTQYPM